MKLRKIPARMCVSCREMKPKKELIRVVRSPAGVVSIDAIGKSAGRGAYICRRRECVDGAKKGRKLEKGLDVGDCSDIYLTLAELCAEAEPAPPQAGAEPAASSAGEGLSAAQTGAVKDGAKPAIAKRAGTKKAGAEPQGKPSAAGARNAGQV